MGNDKNKTLLPMGWRKVFIYFLDREDGKGRTISGCVSKLRHGFTCTEKYRPHCQSVMDLKPGANIALTSTATTLNIGRYFSSSNGILDVQKKKRWNHLTLPENKVSESTKCMICLFRVQTRRFIFTCSLQPSVIKNI